ncbi:hypothetical protein C0Q70_19539 [Pomacea canaliculata]|uniref:Uncharacterized protein n=1 Tax=Pomacea canaliculata TaxID=400727 RepID=A0A2T7NJN5_POMCA|nr:hypothetical protein C0Q70_19539 [Pomacea canaliculata]
MSAEEARQGDIAHLSSPEKLQFIASPAVRGPGEENGEAVQVLQSSKPVVSISQRDVGLPLPSPSSLHKRLAFFGCLGRHTDLLQRSLESAAACVL